MSRGTYLVMRYAPRLGWQGKYPIVAARHRSYAAAFAEARDLRIRYRERVWIAASGAPATLPARVRQRLAANDAVAVGTLLKIYDRQHALTDADVTALLAAAPPSDPARVERIRAIFRRTLAERGEP